MPEFEKVVAQVEQAARGVLPVQYREWLRQHRPGPSDHRQTPFDIERLLKTQRLVQEVIPPGTLAIAGDGYGNLVLLRFSNGSIEWNHQRETDDLDTETIAASFDAFLELVSKGEV